MTRLAAELLAQLTLGNAECTARHSNRPAHAGLFPDRSVSLVTIEEGRESGHWRR